MDWRCAFDTNWKLRIQQFYSNRLSNTVREEFAIGSEKWKEKEEYSKEESEFLWHILYQLLWYKGLLFDTIEKKKENEHKKIDCKTVCKVL